MNARKADALRAFYTNLRLKNIKFFNRRYACYAGYICAYGANAVSCNHCKKSKISNSD